MQQETAKASYPDVFFALEDTEAHQYVVLNDPDHCLCVLLSAKGGPALPCEAGSGAGGGAGGDNDASQLQPRVLMFSGFVGYDQLQVRVGLGDPTLRLPKNQTETRPRQKAKHQCVYERRQRSAHRRVSTLSFGLPV